MAVQDRWPPVYDADELNRAIRDLGSGAPLEKLLYGSVNQGGALCQGDVIEMATDLPILDEQGEPAATDRFTFWLVIGNTCDFDRSVEKVAWTQVVPILDLHPANPTQEDIRSMRQYERSRVFFLPPWESGGAEAVLSADFLRPVALHKQAALKKARVVARLSRYGWALLHACLVRFLARDDGRFDAPPRGLRQITL